MREPTAHPPSTEASTRRSAARRAVIGGTAGVALLAGSAALASTLGTDGADASRRVEAERQTSLVNARQQSAEALEADVARVGALQSLRTTTTAPPTTTTTAPPTTTTTAPPPTTAPPTTAPPPPPPAGSVEAIIHAHFGAAGDQAVIIARCESGLNPSAIGAGRYYGLFQLGRDGHAAAFTRVTGRAFDEAWSDPNANAQYAAWLYGQSGWSPWGCRNEL
jgi:hypothetical protein